MGASGGLLGPGRWAVVHSPLDSFIGSIVWPVSIIEWWGTNIPPLEFVGSQFSIVEFSLGDGIETGGSVADFVPVSCHCGGGGSSMAVDTGWFGIGNRDSRSRCGRTTCAAGQTRDASFRTDADASFAKFSFTFAGLVNTLCAVLSGKRLRRRRWWWLLLNLL